MCFFCLHGSQGGELRNINSERLDWIRTRPLLFLPEFKGHGKSHGTYFSLSHSNTVAPVFSLLPHTRVSQDRERDCLGLEKDGQPLYTGETVPRAQQTP